MANALPTELRERALEARERDGLSIAETAARFLLGTATVKRWTRRVKATGSAAPSPMGGTRRIWIGEDSKAALVALVGAMADATIEELRAEYNSRHGTVVSSSSMHRALQRFDLTRKKSVEAMEARTERVIAARATYAAQQSMMIAEDLVFLYACHVRRSGG